MKAAKPTLIVSSVLVFLTVCCVSTARAQQSTFAGKVINQSGQPITNAEVTLNGGQYFTITGKNGAFIIKHIKPGEYTLSVHIVGYQTYTSKIKIDKTGLSHYSITLKAKTYALDQLVVTATRTHKKKEDIAVPVTIINKEEIENTGSVRLSEILAEQTGLMLVANHGLGVQMQGLESAYTRIMINGQPIVGRTAGTLDLDRISISNVERIEVIRGPSSSLYGSDALAGVINIITEQAVTPFKMELTGRYGSHQTMNLGTNVAWSTDNWRSSLFLNRYSSAGYRLIESSISQTVPKFQNYTLSYRTNLSLHNNIDAKFYGRYYKGDQDINSFVDAGNTINLLDIDEDLQNYSINPALKFHLSPLFSISIEHYLSGYKTERVLRFKDNGDLYDQNIFDQTLNKTEAQGILSFNDNQITTFGGGYSWEKLQSARYPDDPRQQNLFLYGQHDWQVSPKLNVVAGLRYDNHSEYADQFSPKFAIQYKITNWLRVQASTGRGFKAPGFQQLYLDFTNSTAGYSVFGASTVVKRVNELQAAGKIERILIPLNQLDLITAEQSWSYNTGVEIVPSSKFQFSINAFRNNLANLIEAAPIAIKQNGQSVFSYFNRQDVYTQGINAQVNWIFLPDFRLSIGYQWLMAERKIEETRTVQNEQGNAIEKTFVSYQPLFNRSKHSGTLKLFYSYKPLAIQANIRGTYRGQYGFIDSNANGYLNEGEYTDGYMIWDATVSKTFMDSYRLQAGIDNVFNITRPGVVPHLAGRLFYLQFAITL